MLIEPGLAIGMNRLSIIDIEGGHQPIYSYDKRFAIIFNGEVYNYQSLRKELDYPFSTETDTEVVLAGFVSKGLDFFRRLNGIFSFCIFDRTTDNLVLARDPVGVKPLYYSKLPRRFVFGSELKMFSQAGLVDKADHEAVLQYLSSGYVFGPSTALRNVVQVRPGTALLVKSDLSIEHIDYLSPPETFPDHPQMIDGAGYGEVVKQALYESVRRQLVADVPVGLLLSSGLDSMAILACLKSLGKLDEVNNLYRLFRKSTFF